MRAHQRMRWFRCGDPYGSFSHDLQMLFRKSVNLSLLSKYNYQNGGLENETSRWLNEEKRRKKNRAQHKVSQRTRLGNTSVKYRLHLCENSLRMGKTHHENESAFWRAFLLPNARISMKRFLRGSKLSPLVQVTRNGKCISPPHSHTLCARPLRDRAHKMLSNSYLAFSWFWSMFMCTLLAYLHFSFIIGT